MQQNVQRTRDETTCKHQYDRKKKTNSELFLT